MWRCGFAARWWITVEKFWGTADSVTMDGDNLWPGLVLLRKPMLMENSVLGLAWSKWRGCPQGLDV